MLNKVMKLEQVIERIPAGSSLLLGGFGMVRKPMTLVRALAAAERRNLKVITVAGGMDVDLLLAAGAVEELWASFVGFDQMGLAPAFRRQRQAGKLRFREGSENIMLTGLEAASRRLPFGVTRSGLGSGLLEVNPAYQVITSPFGSDKVVAVPSLQADVALIHVNWATPAGTGLIEGEAFADELCSRAARQVFLSCERLVSEEELPRQPQAATDILRSQVTGVVLAPGGAQPTACYPDYRLDVEHTTAYLRLASDPDTFREGYLKALDRAGSLPAVV